MPAKNLLWGTYTWILFHWMAENIKDTEFKKEKKKIINIITKICHNLPCPDCRAHAIQFLKQHRINEIQTKEDLSYYIHYFHNAVNTRLTRTIGNNDILEKYKNVNINKLIQAWNMHFKDMKGVNQYDFMAKQRINSVKQIVNSYIQNNLHKFR